MKILSRVLRLYRANLHSAIDRLENKESMLIHYVREMEGALARKERHHADLGAVLKKMQATLAGFRETDKKLEKSLNEARRKGEEETARMIAGNRRSMAAGYRRLKQRIRNLSEETEQLAQTLTRQRIQYQTIRIRVAAFRHVRCHHRYETPAEGMRLSEESHSCSPIETEPKRIDRQGVGAARKGGVP